MLQLRAGRSIGFEPLERRTMLASVAYDVNQTFQTMLDLGGNYSRAPFQDYPANDAIGQYTLDNLKPGIVRVPLFLKDWEPTNDDADATTRNWAGFHDAGESRDIFLMMQEYERRGLTIIASVYDAPDWMVSNPGNTNQRVVPAENYAELTESMASWLERAKEVYGVSVDYVSFNESNGGYRLLFSAAEHANFIKQSTPTFIAEGNNVKWLTGDTYQVKGTAAYAGAILQDAGARPYLGPISFHTWWSESIPASDWQSIATLAKQYGKQVWATEVGYDATAWTSTPWIFPTWQNARRIATTYHKAVKFAGATAGLYWQYQDDFPLMSADTTDQYYAYHVVKQLVENFGKGTTIVGATSDTSSILALAGKAAWADRFSSQLINTSDADQTVTLTGLPNNPMTLVRSSIAGEEGKTIGTFTPVNGTLTLTLKGQSVSMLKGKLAAATGNTIVRAATADAYVRDGSAYANTNFGQALDLQVKTGSLSGYRRESALRFDLSSLPTVGKATLRLYGKLTDSSATNIPIAVYKGSSGTWTENGVTWNTKPGVSGAAAATRTVTDATARWYEFDLTSLVKAEKAAGRTTLNLVLRALTGSSPYVSFNSAEAATNRPQLVITTNTAQQPAPPPPAQNGSTSLAATDDAYVRDGSAYAATNFGQAGELQVKSAALAGYRRESLLKFNLSDVSSMTSVKLRLFGRLSDASTSNVRTGVYKASGSTWTENGVTWNTRPGVSGSAAGGFSVTDSIARWYELDITALARAEKAAGRTALALVLRNLTNTGNYTVFNSAEATANRPELLITK